MWNHAQNCLSFGNEESGETDRNSGLNISERIEKSLDLTQYLKYLDNLFSQPTSESESSDSDEGDGRTFTDFLQPPAQPSDRTQLPFNQGSMFLGSSPLSGSNHLSSFAALKPSESLHLEANISSSSISSIDSGTSSLSLNLSTDFYPDVPLTKLDDGVSQENPNAVKSPNLCTDSSSSSAPGTDYDKPDENGTEKDKKSQKKKKASKSSNVDFPRQNKPSSDGKGNNGSKGGGYGGGSSTPGGGSGEGSASTGSGNSSNQGGLGGAAGSSGAKNRSGKNNLQYHSPQEGLKMRTLTIQPDKRNRKSSSLDLIQPLRDDPDGHLNSIISNSDDLLLNGELTDNFSSDFLTSGESDAFDVGAMNSLPLTAILDISEDENSLNDYISTSASVSANTQASSSSSSLSQSQSSTKSFSKVITAAASATISCNKEVSLVTGQSDRSLKINEKKRKSEVHMSKGTPDKLAKLSEKQRQSRLEFLNAKRKKIYVYICRKEIGKTQKNRANIFKESLSMKRKLAQACERHLKKMAHQSQKTMKESVCRAKKLTQEMEAHWKRVERAERDLERMKEKEAEEKHKHELEIMEKKIEDIKFNRLIVQTELLAAKLFELLGKVMDKEEILSRLEDVEDEYVLKLDGHDRDRLRSHVQIVVDRALKEHQSFVKYLDMSGAYLSDAWMNKVINQPHMFEGILENYQVKGLNWLKNLYIQGLNGILADDAGLGKKTQIVAFLSYLAESLGVWGPFLIVAPTSSLYKWQLIFDKLAPRLTIASYWGKPVERKGLRQFWEKNNFHKEEASLHVVVTSYEVMISDLKYFSKIKWQYLITDDTQGALTTSTKWMSILSFRCRNKLLVCDSRKLNSSSNLCSYVYFIMPSLFDSREEFSEWLLRELESSTAKKHKKFDGKYLTRIRSVIQRFLLYRTKQEVENEIAQNFDVELSCALSSRQQRIYSDLAEKVNLPENLENLERLEPDKIKSRMKEVLNLLLQLQRACSHPDFVKERDRKCPFWMCTNPFFLSKLIFLNGPRTDAYPSSDSSFIINHLFCVYNSINVHNSLFNEAPKEACKNVTSFNYTSSSWSFSRLLELSCSEVEEMFKNPFSSRLNHLVNLRLSLERINFESVWKKYDTKRVSFLEYPCIRFYHSLCQSKVLGELAFTSVLPTMYKWGECMLFSIKSNTIENRSLKSRNTFLGIQYPSGRVNKTTSNSSTRLFQPLEFPKFLRCYSERVESRGYKATILRSKTKRYDFHCTLNEILQGIRENNSKLACAISTAWNGYIKNSGLSGMLDDSNQFISDSGKLRRLDGLLSSLKMNGNRVLLCSYNHETINMLEKYLTLRGLKFVIIDKNLNNCQLDTFVFLLFAKKIATNISTIAADTVIFYDQDWTSAVEEEKTKITNLLAHSAQVNYYRLMSKGTIEERLMRISKERNAVSFTLCKDALENGHVTSVPSLKNLVSVLMCNSNLETDCHKNDVNINQKSSKIKVNCTVHMNIKEEESKNISEEASFDFLEYSNGKEGSDCGSPSVCCGSEQLHDGEIDVGVTVKECQDDTFSYSFDEGYMGLSPGSYEDAADKSDYEDDSSPTKNKVGRGSGKRGRPPSRVRLHRRDFSDGSLFRRGPGRPRLKPLGPPNQGIRGRKPGRPPLTKKTETISSSLASLASGQRVFGFYSSPDLELS